MKTLSEGLPQEDDFLNMLHNYISDEKKFSASHLGIGMGTEFNAHTYGLKASYKKENIGDANAQRVGVIFFINMHKVYLKNLKRYYFQAYTRLTQDTLYVRQVNKLFQQAIIALKESSYPFNLDPHGIEARERRWFSDLGGNEELAEFLERDILLELVNLMES